MGLSKNEGGLGFREVEAFNKALLAKQCWRVLMNPQSLAAVLLKDKYFRNTDLLHATLGFKPSFMWKSLWDSLSLLKEGLVWRVGNGKSIKIWGDRWVPKAVTFKIQSPIQILNAEARVEELLSGENGGWNEGLIKQVFDKEEAAIVCNLPISFSKLPDKQIWAFSKNGIYNVKSAYHVEDQMELIAVVLRRIWFRRNGWVFENRFEGPNDVFSQAANCLSEYQQAQETQQAQPKQSNSQCGRALHWKPPEGDTVKVNWDAALKSDDRKCGMGVVIRDRCGDVLASLCSCRWNVSNPVVAEVHALWRAMKLCEELKFSKVQLEGDAKSVINAVNNAEECWEWHGQLIEDVKSVLKNRKQWSVLHVNRVCNSVAHDLAKSALFVEEERVWMEDHPQELLKAVNFDKLCNSVNK
ncbi:uncharacterized protein LOC122304861 [Carya illinoinensis]|uniref:uncharacterized protein LOC122304861 n=1 Tax=Carya illinoinensis TaxID=32201 RepID=UPI001C717F2D|nr:uncharacterized protein LOC122304861 [Carya illinoinensis]